MSYQSVFPFDKEYPWINLVHNLKRLNQGEKIVFYGFEGRKIIIRKVHKDSYLICSYSMNALKFNIEQEGKLKFVEVEFMSTIIKGVDKHIHIFEKSATSNKDWRKQVYRCKDPLCTYYNSAQYIEGKEIRCFKCYSPFILGKSQLWQRNKKLICLACSKSPKKVAVSAGKSIFDDILNEMEKDPVLQEIKKEKIDE